MEWSIEDWGEFNHPSIDVYYDTSTGEQFNWFDWSRQQIQSIKLLLSTDRESSQIRQVEEWNTAAAQQNIREEQK